MPRTRSSKPTATESQETESASLSSSKFSLSERNGSPPKLFILPKKATSEAKIITLPHPRHTKPARYLVCPETGFYEFTKIAAPKSAPRSWLIETSAKAVESEEDKDGATQGQLISNADLFVATSMDPLFLLLPALADSCISKSSEDKKRLFLSSDDYFDKLPEEASHLSEILRWEKTRALLEARMAAICDTVEAGDETMFRLSQEKAASACLQKARRLAQGNVLPPSLESQFVTKALQAPVLNQKRAPLPSESQTTNGVIESGESTPLTESNDSQSTAMSTETSATSVDESTEVEQAIRPSHEVMDLQKLRVAFDLICARLVSPAITKWLKEGLSDERVGGVDFAPLDEYLAKLAELRAEAVASRSMGDYSQKRLRDEEEEEAREQKKRKLEEEKKKKASESRGVRELKKVNTSGMMKLSSFFQKK
ncbi:Ribonuclease H2 subunit B-like protein [Hapsidospora chrysogenum ATCC 11550]|uniref:Ribonuclease H2 subunit B n=1 Tax=Hapsidospora chrysogenum (strain ATCC 11550 / CBS 779.69 / DSM 880 / IAM 14645 / JCM 23072 / IMI 49137) TaxID=857340 RepID=A0A086T993_HAPC1|nr:Ribonuclease H2 subunit B-like protein [Hapsidospora chrysogenum ATCC 11550]